MLSIDLALALVDQRPLRSVGWGCKANSLVFGRHSFYHAEALMI